MSYVITTYTMYLVLTITLTIWVARTLFRNGKVFLVDIFHGNAALANSVNNLLLVGFYLINIGYAVRTLSITENIGDTRQLIEMLSIKVGAIILILGVMHFFNMAIFFKLRSRALQHGKFSAPAFPGTQEGKTKG
ncbi:MAG TPA: hypothetical protein VMH27_17790 [Puia sp.]|nr:hypothetical protein [Puia sp.]